MREVAEWLVNHGYPVDFACCWAAPPVDLWEAVVDVIFEDRDGSWHGNELSRDEVDAWLRDETSGPTP